MNKDVFRLVILTLGATIVLSIIAIAVLAALGETIPGIFETAIASCVTGIVGLLARHPDDNKVAEVEVVNTTPVPVVDETQGGFEPTAPPKGGLTP